MKDHPLAYAANWLNPSFTLAAFTLDIEFILKVAAFLFVTLPLGVIQWWSLVDKWKARRASRDSK